MMFSQANLCLVNLDSQPSFTFTWQLSLQNFSRPWGRQSQLTFHGWKQRQGCNQSCHVRRVLRTAVGGSVNWRAFCRVHAGTVHIKMKNWPSWLGSSTAGNLSHRHTTFAHCTESFRMCLKDVHCDTGNAPNVYQYQALQKIFFYRSIWQNSVWQLMSIKSVYMRWCIWPN